MLQFGKLKLDAREQEMRYGRGKGMPPLPDGKEIGNASNENPNERKQPSLIPTFGPVVSLEA